MLVWVTSIDGLALVGACFLLSAAPASAAAATPNYMFGVVQANQAVSQAQALGVGWTRVPMPWANLQPSPGTWNNFYTNNDKQFLQLAGYGIVPVGVVETVPAWASVNPAQAPDGVPKGLTLPWNSPQNYWGQFMYELARHYAGLINTWIIGNEISIHSGPNKSFDGTTQQMAEMVRVAYQAVHAANPVGSVQAPGAPYWYTKGNTTNALLNDLAKLPGAKVNHDFIDGLNLHIYNTVQWNPVIYARYRQILKQHGIGTLPIWLSETNAAPHAPEDPAATPADQANFLIENLAASLAYVNHVEVYKMTNPVGSRVDYGLINANGTLSPGYTAVQTLSQALLGTQFLHAAVLPYEWNATSSPAIITFGGVKKLVNVVWDQGFKATTVTLPAYSVSAMVLTASGGSYSVQAKQGHFLLHLAPAKTHSPSTPTNAPIGGPPLIVVQTMGLGQAGTPTTAPVNSPTEFAAASSAGQADWSGELSAVQGTEIATIDPTSSTVTITDNGQSVTVGGWGTGSGQLLGPSGVAIGPTGTVYVTNSGANDVVVYSPTGQVVATWGKYGTHVGQFNGPSGIAVGPNGNVYVADTLNQRVQRFSPSGQYMGEGPAQWPTQITIPSSNQIQYSDPMLP